MNKTLEQLGVELGQLVQSKNIAYGSSFAKCGDFLQILYPEGIKPEQYVDVLLTVRIFDKLMRIATNKGAFQEVPWHDVAGYGLLGVYKEEGKGDSDELTINVSDTEHNADQRIPNDGRNVR